MTLVDRWRTVYVPILILAIANQVLAWTLGGAAAAVSVAAAVWPQSRTRV